MYKHTQIGWLILISFGIAILLIGYFGFRDSNWTAISVSGILVVCLILFSSLTVTVNDNLIEIRFGIGAIRKKFRLEEIDSCRTVKNRWWYGWGIRILPKGWLFNVSGLDAVELSMRNGKIYRIGTDEQEELSNFIQGNLNKGSYR